MKPEDEAEAALHWRFTQREQRLREEQQNGRQDRIEEAARVAYRNQGPAPEPGRQTLRPYEHFLFEEQTKRHALDQQQLVALRAEYEQERARLGELAAKNGFVQRSGPELAAEAIKDEQRGAAREVPSRDPRREFNVQAQRETDAERLVIEGHARQREAARQRTPEQEVIYQKALAETRRRMEEEREKDSKTR